MSLSPQLFFAVSGAGNIAILVMLLTELTGLYAISSLLLIRRQLPLKYRCGHAAGEGDERGSFLYGDGGVV